MKKIMFILILVSSLWSEEIKIDDIYEVYISKTKNIDLVGSSKKEVYFGKYVDYLQKKSDELKTMGKNLGNGAISGLSTASNGAANSVGNATGKAVGQGLGMGLGIGLVYGLAELTYNKATEDEIYVLVNDYENSKGEKTRISALLIANSFKNEPVVKEFLLQEISKKYIKKD